MRKLAFVFLILAAGGIGSLWVPPPEPAFACAASDGCVPSQTISALARN
jgi:hypothetical protein